MPPRNSPPNPPDPRALLGRYNISIEGPIRPRDWPRKYAPLFSLVRDTEKVLYEEYEAGSGSDDPRLLHVSRMCKQVTKLVYQAYGLRESQDNEYTWRSATENQVLKRFLRDVDCHVCNERLWISDFQAVPSCPMAAEKLQQVRAARSLCRCSKAMRAKVIKRVLPHHKPDRILGLRKANEIKDLLEANPDITSAVTKAGTDLVFPFLVLEAKSEKDTDGFEAIERQTAFPIRAMVNIQKDLESVSAVPVDPLRIIDLWHGCVLRHDSALQLFLIMDLVCDWARDIFTEQVLGSLRQRAGLGVSIPMSQASLEELSSFEHPSSCSPHGGNEGRSSLSNRSTTLESARDSNSDDEVAIKSEPADVMTWEVPNSTHDNTENPCSRTSNAGLSTECGDAPEIPEWSNTPDAWMEHIAIRSDKDIQIQFRSISLPESPDGLYPLIKAIGNPDIVHTARRLFALFNLEDPFIVESHFVDRLHRIWGKPQLKVPYDDKSLLFASLSWRTSFDYVDWVLTKELSCITASRRAIAALATVGQVSGGHLLTVGGIESAILEKYLIYPLRHLPLIEMVHAASRNQFLHLQACDGFADPSGWTADDEKGAFSKLFWDSLGLSPDAFLECTRNIYTCVRGRPNVLEFRNDVKIPPPLQVPWVAKEHPIALIRRPSDMGECIGQEYCIFVLDREVVRSPTEIASAILSLLHDENSRFYGSNEPFTAADRKDLALLGSFFAGLDPEQFVFPSL
ncbi:predicted protein [Aspergillus terreus NIH2624]|uniref:Uncharacterized protein n=1 Tax=Aspergillus terreus (strain NIH 2624 / FGSC A1156) TaxID=341663 RepID=Q0CU33_ASPTN|nr:uncharacterized protein ATEG_02801 [Aspergillus terreus NIH2624]EAU36075.1 predicted protein [Aspergillus terreus NIH2624]